MAKRGCVPIPTWRIIQGDSLRELPLLKAESVDLVCTDPPYGISYVSHARQLRGALAKVANDERPFIWWVHEATRVLKSPGALVCFCRWDVQEAFRLAITLAGLDVRGQLVWDRGRHGSGNTDMDFAPQHDVMWFATKGSFRFPGRRPKSVIRCAKPHAHELRHATEKPLGLMIELVDTLAPPAGMVLDPFNGSGATGEAAILCGRSYIGIELDKHHAAASRRRLDSSAPLYLGHKPPSRKAKGRP